jgi:aryl carrier-like protein
MRDHRDILLEIWQSLLGTRPGENSSFLHDGGSSLQLMELQLEFHRRTGATIDFDRLSPPFPFHAMVAVVANSASGDVDEGGVEGERA